MKSSLVYPRFDTSLIGLFANAPLQAVLHRHRSLFVVQYGDPQFRLTDYGRTNAFEYWAEAVTDWVYGERYKGPGGVFAEQDRGFLSALQVSFLETWLGGR